MALIRTDVSKDRIASIFRVHECELVTERSCKLLYRHRLVGDVLQLTGMAVLVRDYRLRHLIIHRLLLPTTQVVITIFRYNQSSYYVDYCNSVVSSLLVVGCRLLLMSFLLRG
jgi:hypothetical protein